VNRATKTIELTPVLMAVEYPEDISILPEEAHLQ
jgi:hypothetical protein